MNSSPVESWTEFDSRSTEAIYTFADQPMVVQGICLLVLVVVVLEPSKVNSSTSPIWLKNGTTVNRTKRRSFETTA